MAARHTLTGEVIVTRKQNYVASAKQNTKVDCDKKIKLWPQPNKIQKEVEQKR